MLSSINILNGTHNVVIDTELLGRQSLTDALYKLLGLQSSAGASGEFLNNWALSRPAIFMTHFFFWLKNIWINQAIFNFRHPFIYCTSRQTFLSEGPK